MYGIVAYIWLILMINVGKYTVRPMDPSWDRDYNKLGGGNSNIFYVHPKPWGRWTQFDEHILQMGWFNHATSTPKMFNMEPENDGFQVRNLLFQWLIFRFHVKLQGCKISSYLFHPKISSCWGQGLGRLKNGRTECIQVPMKMGEPVVGRYLAGVIDVRPL